MHGYKGHLSTRSVFEDLVTPFGTNELKAVLLQQTHKVLRGKCGSSGHGRSKSYNQRTLQSAAVIGDGITFSLKRLHI